MEDGALRAVRREGHRLGTTVSEVEAATILAAASFLLSVLNLILWLLRDKK